MNKNWMNNTILTIVALSTIFAITLAADWFAGRLLAAMQPPGNMELIFPPKSEKSFESAEFKYDVHINSLGLRDHEIGPKKPSTFRIIAIGDSFTYGWGVNVEQSWPKLLEQNLQKAGHNAEVINLGKPGAGPPFYAEVAERAIPILHPDLVLVTPLQDDVGEAMPDGQAPTTSTTPRKSILDHVRYLYPNLVRLVRNREAMRAKSTPVSSPEHQSIEDNRRMNIDAANRLLNQMTPEQRTRFDNLEERVKDAFRTGNLNPYMLDLSVMKNPDYYRFLLKVDDDYIKLCTNSMATQFRRITNVATEYGAKVLVVPIPLGPYVNDEANHNAQRVGFITDTAMIDNTDADETFRRAASTAICPFATITQGFKERRNLTGLYYELDGHFTPKGHALFAELITPVAEKELK